MVGFKLGFYYPQKSFNKNIIKKGTIYILLSINPLSKEAWFYMPSANKLEQCNMVKEGTKLTAQTKVDNDLMAAIAGEDGFMRAGALPSLPTATKGGAKKLLDAVTQAFGG